MGDTLIYKDEIQPVTFSGMNLDVFSMGEIDDDMGDKQVMTQLARRESQYKKLYFDRDELIGGILIGNVDKANVLIKGVREKHDTGRVMKKLYR